MSLVDHLEKRQPKSVWMRLMREHPEYFDEAVMIAISDKHPEGWRAAWLVCHNMHRNDQRIQPLLSDMIRSLKGKESGHQRELLKIIFKMKLTEEHEGPLFDACLTIWEDLSKQSSVRIVAFKQLANIARDHAELKSELKHFTADHYLASLSPGIKRSFEKYARYSGL